MKDGEIYRDSRGFWIKPTDDGKQFIVGCSGGAEAVPLRMAVLDTLEEAHIRVEVLKGSTIEDAIREAGNRSKAVSIHENIMSREDARLGPVVGAINEGCRLPAEATLSHLGGGLVGIDVPTHLGYVLLTDWDDGIQWGLYPFDGSLEENPVFKLDGVLADAKIDTYPDVIVGLINEYLAWQDKVLADWSHPQAERAPSEVAS